MKPIEEEGRRWWCWMKQRGRRRMGTCFQSECHGWDKFLVGVVGSSKHQRRTDQMLNRECHSFSAKQHYTNECADKEEMERGWWWSFLTTKQKHLVCLCSLTHLLSLTRNLLYFCHFRHAVSLKVAHVILLSASLTTTTTLTSLSSKRTHLSRTSCFISGHLSFSRHTRR